MTRRASADFTKLDPKRTYQCNGCGRIKKPDHVWASRICFNSLCALAGGFYVAVDGEPEVLLVADLPAPAPVVVEPESALVVEPESALVVSTVAAPVQAQPAAIVAPTVTPAPVVQPATRGDVSRFSDDVSLINAFVARFKTQGKAAESIGVSGAAVSQWRSNKKIGTSKDFRSMMLAVVGS